MFDEAQVDDTRNAAASTNYELFRECFSEVVLQHLAPVASNAKSKKRRAGRAGRNGIKNGAVNHAAMDPMTKTSDAEELSDFIEYLAEDMFTSLPLELRILSFAATKNDSIVAAAYAAPLPASTLETVAMLLPPSTIDSLSAYGLLPTEPDSIDITNLLLTPVLTSYTTAATTAPASLTFETRATACEICQRDWIPLTYHHLIPRSMHAKTLKRGWHEEWELNRVAWLCRACHSMVHRIASNEELAREYCSVEKLLERDEVKAFATWVGGVRWRAR